MAPVSYRPDRWFFVFFAILPLIFSENSQAANERGKAIFDLCITCHGTVGQGRQDLEAPSIAGLPKWYVAKQLGKFKNGQRGKHSKDVAGLRMRPMARTLQTEDDIQAVADYVSGLTRAKPAVTLSGDATKGQAKYATCQACHGADGNGMEALGAPPLKNANDWYLLTQLKNFKAKVRGDAAVDPTGAVMTPMAQTLEDEQAMKDVISYVQTLQ